MVGAQNAATNQTRMATPTRLNGKLMSYFVGPSTLETMFSIARMDKHRTDFRKCHSNAHVHINIKWHQENWDLLWIETEKWRKNVHELLHASNVTTDLDRRSDTTHNNGWYEWRTLYGLISTSSSSSSCFVFVVFDLVVSSSRFVSVEYFSKFQSTVPLLMTVIPLLFSQCPQSNDFNETNWSN